ncbi:MAG TPA: hypothetical protein VG649_16770 [Candidatus Angelobacter sp.]|jgi:hypothetical protein|nr:hypothetical protein [Candidatus Angelobacter sp.]
MTIPQKVARILGILLIAGLCVTPEMMQAVTQQSSQPGAPQSSQQSQSSDNKQGGQNSQSTTKPDDQSQTPTKPQGSGTTVDPSQAPLQPVTTYPEAPTPQQDQQPGNAQPVQQSEQAQQPKKPATEPAGAATAEKVPTTGGAASRPAGVAIAPAKQHQTRSLLIKIGAIAAAGAAAGTVYGLSRGTPSTPGGAGVRK